MSLFCPRYEVVEPVLRPSKGNIRGLFLCHCTRHLKSLVFARITRVGERGRREHLLKFRFLVDSNPHTDLWWVQECVLLSTQQLGMP